MWFYFCKLEIKLRVTKVNQNLYLNVDLRKTNCSLQSIVHEFTSATSNNVSLFR